MTKQTLLQEIATLRGHLDLLEADPEERLYALVVKQAAESVVFCAEKLTEAKAEGVL